MNTAFKKIAACTAIVLLSVSIWSGFGSAAESPSKTFKASGVNSETYFLHGTKISTIYPCTFTCFDMEPARDTTSVTFTTHVWSAPGKKDTLRFFGLLGADAGESGPNQFIEFVFPIELHHGDQYRIYARKTDNDKFEIEAWGTGSRYIGTGSFGNNTIQLQGMYQYRNRSFAYDLEGVRIEE